MTWERISGHGRSIAFWVLFASCPAFGLLLSDLPDLKVYKALNAIGIAWNILGLVTLSYLTAATEKFQLSALRISSFLFGILLVQFPLGLMWGGLLALFLHYPSAKVAVTTGGYLLFPGALSMFLFTDYIDPKPRWSYTTQKRVGFMGGYFLFAGLLAQLFGAIFDLVDFNG